MSMFYLPIYTRFGLTQKLRNSVWGERVSHVDIFVVQALLGVASAILYIKTHIKQYKIIFFFGESQNLLPSKSYISDIV